jgi:hypothetical protein
VAGGIVTFLLLQKRGQLGGLIRRFAARKSGRTALKKIEAEISGVDRALSAFYRDQPLGLWFAVLWHVIGFSVGILQSWIFFRLISPGTSAGVIAAAWFLSMWFDLLTFIVPLNAGSLEGGRILTFRALGYSSLMGLTYGVALRLAQLFWAGLGLLLYGWESARGTGPSLRSFRERRYCKPKLGPFVSIADAHSCQTTSKNKVNR